MRFSALFLVVAIGITACVPTKVFKTSDGRIIARDGTFIKVDMENYMLHAYENGKEAFTMPVIIGRDSRPTPEMLDKIVNLKFSPTWTPPKSIIKKDLLPKFRKNDKSAKGFKVYLRGKPINPDMVHWDSVDEKDVTLVQPSGRRNALGGVRFSLTNSKSIYLHDTPNKSLFKNRKRAFSSGCIRVFDAVKLAQWVLKLDGKNWTKAQIENAMSGGTKFVTLKRSVPVYITHKKVKSPL